jgi:hypothetical protein
MLRGIVGAADGETAMAVMSGATAGAPVALIAASTDARGGDGAAGNPASAVIFGETAETPGGETASAVTLGESAGIFTMSGHQTLIYGFDKRFVVRVFL